MTGPSDFARDYQTVSDWVTSQGAAQASATYVDMIQDLCDRTAGQVEAAARTDQGIHVVKGFAAERWHVGTYNLDMARLGRLDQWNEAHLTTPGSPADIAFGIAGADPVQLKYYRSAENTAKEMSDPRYHDMGKVGPADQIEGIRDVANQLADKNVDSRPHMSEQYRHTADNAAPTLDREGARSRPLSEPEARELAEDARNDDGVDRNRWGLTADQQIQVEHIAGQALHAGMQAAALSASMQLAPLVVAAISQSLRDGHLDFDDLGRMVRGIPAVALRSGIAGGISAALVTASRSGMLGEAATSVAPEAISATVVLSISCLQTACQAASGEITWAQANVAMASNALVLAGSMAGGMLGQAIIPIPVLGSMIGSLVGATLARMVIGQTQGFLMGLAVERGWTVLDVVTQDYTLPADALIAAGWEPLDMETLDMEPLDMEPLDMEPLDMEPLTVNGVPIRMLRRGLIGIGRVGYL